MRVGDAFGAGKFGLSYELFPPKSPAGETELFGHLRELMAYRPDFVTCTYGAGGSTRDKTLEIITRVRDEHRLSVASHLTCVGSTVEQLREYLAEARRRGVENIVALRGDPPRGETSFRPIAGGFAYANELVALIRREFPEFGIAVAGYPETHVEAPSSEIDLQNLARKVAAGGDVVITQLFYRNDDFLRFRDRCTAVGIRVPIVPGLLPVTNLNQIRRITSLCGAKLPAEFLAALERCGDDETAQIDAGIDFAAQQLSELIAAGIPGVHFYVLNKSQAMRRILAAVPLPR
ncbi:MAG: methylenetetrahydrofolate reductase [NAD(P)H] [Pirellulales bacterium]|nr:methylenetetrahydrofolate reductase [NAD(P)H] [Pirellulales bacterium]